jgi:hypothetical protein
MAEEKLKEINIAYEYLKANSPQVERNNSPSSDRPSANITVDSTKLRHLLELGKWQDADFETQQILLRLAAREKEGWLDKEALPYLW